MIVRKMQPTAVDRETVGKRYRGTGSRKMECREFCSIEGIEEPIAEKE